MKKKVLGLASLLLATTAATAFAAPSVQVVAGASRLSDTEKASVTGKCGCYCAPLPSKPGYGFGTTNHYGPPGQGFTPSNNWRNHASGDGLTPKGKALPPRAFTAGS